MTDNKKDLNNEEKHVIEKCGTEPAFSSDLLEVEENGVFKCKKCGQELFDSNTKFKSGTGWPSFWEPKEEDSIEKQPDGRRTEVVCSNCGGHLGHVFNDGPQDKTGKRFCINGVALDFEKATEGDNDE